MSSDLLDELLGAFKVRHSHDERDALRHLLTEARASSASAEATVLGLIERRGHRLSPRGAAHLHGARQRKEDYNLAMRRSRGAVMKGEAIAQYYPDGLERFSNDVDLLLPDESALWDEASRVERTFSPDDAALTLIGDDTVVTFRRRSRFSAEERDLKIELSTVGFPGDGLGATIWRPQSSYGPGFQLHSLTEERFQRVWRPMDAVDAAWLTRAGAWEALENVDAQRARALLDLATFMRERITLSVPHAEVSKMAETARTGATKATGRRPSVQHGLRVTTMPRPLARWRSGSTDYLTSPVGTFVLSDTGLFQSRELARIAAEAS